VRKLGNDKCLFCKDNRDFEMPTRVIESALESSLVIFAGSGISTENKRVFPSTFLDEIKAQLPNEYKDSLFPDAMSAYCLDHGRRALVVEILKRIKYVKSFSAMYRQAVRFHKELSHIHQITEIFTTNWDDFFEQECGAIPFVTSNDFAFWNLPDRKVFKLHGSINNIGTIVATREDYESCYSRLQSELIGNYFRVSLATKTVVFIGYSLRDEDLREIIRLLGAEIGEFKPKYFFVSLEEDPALAEELNVEPIVTDGAFFIHKLKEILVSKDAVIDPQVFLDAFKYYCSVDVQHQILAEEIHAVENPYVIYSLYYLDGLIDFFERAFEMENSGEYSDYERLSRVMNSYAILIEEACEENRYSDVAYLEGYVSGIEYFLKWPELATPQVFYLYPAKLVESLEELKAKLAAKDELDEGALKFAVHIVETTGGEGIVHQHRPFL
jgi:NAD-dependent SIR2 family protein deacetylase